MNISSNSFFPFRFVKMVNYYRQYFVPSRTGTLLTLFPNLSINDGTTNLTTSNLTVLTFVNPVLYIAPRHLSGSSLFPYSLIF